MKWLGSPSSPFSSFLVLNKLVLLTLDVLCKWKIQLNAASHFRWSFVPYHSHPLLFTASHIISDRPLFVPRPVEYENRKKWTEWLNEYSVERSQQIYRVREWERRVAEDVSWEGVIVRMILFNFMDIFCLRRALLFPFFCLFNVSIGSWIDLYTSKVDADANHLWVRCHHLSDTRKRMHSIHNAATSAKSCTRFLACTLALTRDW